MGLKEVDKVRMTGVLPSQGADPIPVGKIPDGGTQVVGYGSADNSSTTIHTVGSGNTLYASQVICSVRNTADVSGYGRISVTNAADALQYHLVVLEVLPGSGFAISIPFMPPLEIPAGWKIVLLSSIAGIAAYGLVHGYEA